MKKTQRRPVTIYALCEDDGDIRYVGRTVQPPQQRYRSHLSLSKLGGGWPVNRWIAKRQAEGRGVVLSILERAPINSDWSGLERAWIQRCLAEGCRLLNLTLGGDGSMPGGRRYSLAQFAWNASRFMQRYCLCQWCGASFWRRPSECRRGHDKFCSRSCKMASQRGVSKPVSALAGIRGRAARARNLEARTHCKRGHPLIGENIAKPGTKRCRTCDANSRREAARRHRARKAAARIAEAAA